MMTKFFLVAFAITAMTASPAFAKLEESETKSSKADVAEAKKAEGGDKEMEKKSADELQNPDMSLSGFSYKPCMSASCDTALSMSSNNDSGMCTSTATSPGPEFPASSANPCSPAPTQTAELRDKEETRQ